MKVVIVFTHIPFSDYLLYLFKGVNMRICDLAEDEVVIGLRVKSLKNGRPGIITKIDLSDDRFTTIIWEDGNESGFYGNDCECEILDEVQ
jgi:hypothetical protein